VGSGPRGARPPHALGCAPTREARGGRYGGSGQGGTTLTGGANGAPGLASGRPPQYDPEV
jgi:hypothetical protein